jgi:hypothetical protein
LNSKVGLASMVILDFRALLCCREAENAAARLFIDWRINNPRSVLIACAQRR